MTEQPDAPSSDTVFIQIAPVDSNGRQISRRTELTQSLESRVDDLRRGIQAGALAISESLPTLEGPKDWSVESVDATFGITLGAEGSVIVSKATAEASLEVTISYRRNRNESPSDRD